MRDLAFLSGHQRAFSHNCCFIAVWMSSLSVLMARGAAKLALAAVVSGIGPVQHLVPSLLHPAWQLAPLFLPQV